MKKVCEWCGAEFETNSGTKKYCDGKHYRKCEWCGEEFLVDNSSLGSKEYKKCCSRKCSSELRKATNLEKYGGVAPASSAEIQAKMRATSLERFGVEHAAQSAAIQEKTRATCRERYGVDHYLATEEAKQHNKEAWADPKEKRRRIKAIEEGNLKRFGVKCIFQEGPTRDKINADYKAKTGYSCPAANPEVQAAIDKANIDKYGVRRPFQRPEVIEKMKQYSLKKYGVENSMQRKSVKRKVKKTCLERYGSTCYLSSEEGKAATRKSMLAKYGAENMANTRLWKQHVMSDPSKIDNLMAFDADPIKFIEDHFTQKPSIHDLGVMLGINDTCVGDKIRKFGIKEHIGYVRSYMERAVSDVLDNASVSYLIDDRNAIKPLELDLYLPDYNFAIECNPTCTHNSSCCDPWGGEPKPISYHKQKTDACEAAGIQLFHIYSYEWEHKQDIIISMLLNAIGKTPNVIYARKCEVREVPGMEAAAFLNANHRQGAANSPIRLGLYYNGELVSLMTFGKMRSTIGTGNDDTAECFELVRFCSKTFTSVVGGASKLFKHFVKTYQPAAIRSFSDRAHTSGKLYGNLGFIEIRRSDPGYVWVDVFDDRAYNRVNAQKSHIKQFLGDPDIDLSKTERQIMEEHGFVRMFDAGTITWEWTSESLCR